MASLLELINKNRAKKMATGGLVPPAGALLNQKLETAGDISLRADEARAGMMNPLPPMDGTERIDPNNLSRFTPQQEEVADINNTGFAPRMLHAGVLDVDSGLKAAMAATAQHLGADNFAERNLSEAREDSRRAEMMTHDQIKDVRNIKGLGDILPYIGGQALRAAPQFAAAGAGAALGAGVFGMPALAGAGAASFVQNAGQTYQGIRDEVDAGVAAGKYTPQQAAEIVKNAGTPTAVSAALSAMLDTASMGVIFKANPIAKSAMAGFLGKSLPAHIRNSILTEGVTEATQQYVQTVAQKFALSEPDKFGLTPEEGWEIANAGFAGAAAAGPVAPIGHTRGRIEQGANAVIDGMGKVGNAMGLGEKPPAGPPGTPPAPGESTAFSAGAAISKALDGSWEDLQGLGAKGGDWLLSKAKVIPGVEAGVESAQQFWAGLRQGRRVGQVIDALGKFDQELRTGYEAFRTEVGQTDTSNFESSFERYKEAAAHALGGEGINGATLGKLTGEKVRAVVEGLNTKLPEVEQKTGAFFQDVKAGYQDMRAAQRGENAVHDHIEVAEDTKARMDAALAEGKEAAGPAQKSEVKLSDEAKEFQRRLIDLLPMHKGMAEVLQSRPTMIAKQLSKVAAQQGPEFAALIRQPGWTAFINNDLKMSVPEFEQHVQSWGQQFRTQELERVRGGRKADYAAPGQEGAIFKDPKNVHTPSYDMQAQLEKMGEAGSETEDAGSDIADPTEGMPEDFSSWGGSEVEDPNAAGDRNPQWNPDLMSRVVARPGHNTKEAGSTSRVRLVTRKIFDNATNTPVTDAPATHKAFTISHVSVAKAWGEAKRERSEREKKVQSTFADNAHQNWMQGLAAMLQGYDTTDKDGNVYRTKVVPIKSKDKVDRPATFEAAGEKTIAPGKTVTSELGPVQPGAFSKQLPGKTPAATPKPGEEGHGDPALENKGWLNRGMTVSFDEKHNPITIADIERRQKANQIFTLEAAERKYNETIAKIPEKMPADKQALVKHDAAVRFAKVIAERADVEIQAILDQDARGEERVASGELAQNMVDEAHKFLLKPSEANLEALPEAIAMVHDHAAMRDARSTLYTSLSNTEMRIHKYLGSEWNNVDETDFRDNQDAIRKSDLMNDMAGDWTGNVAHTIEAGARGLGIFEPNELHDARTGKWGRQALENVKKAKERIATMRKAAKFAAGPGVVKGADGYRVQGQAEPGTNVSKGSEELHRYAEGDKEPTQIGLGISPKAEIWDAARDAKVLNALPRTPRELEHAAKLQRLPKEDTTVIPPKDKVATPDDVNKGLDLGTEDELIDRMLASVDEATRAKAIPEAEDRPELGPRATARANLAKLKGTGTAIFDKQLDGALHMLNDRRLTENDYARLAAAKNSGDISKFLERTVSRPIAVSHDVKQRMFEESRADLRSRLADAQDTADEMTKAAIIQTRAALEDGRMHQIGITYLANKPTWSIQALADAIRMREPKEGSLGPTQIPITEGPDEALPPTAAPIAAAQPVVPEAKAPIAAAPAPIAAAPVNPDVAARAAAAPATHTPEQQALMKSLGLTPEMLAAIQEKFGTKETAPEVSKPAEEVKPAFIPEAKTETTEAAAPVGEPTLEDYDKAYATIQAHYKSIPDDSAKNLKIKKNLKAVLGPLREYVKNNGPKVEFPNVEVLTGGAQPAPASTTPSMEKYEEMSEQLKKLHALDLPNTAPNDPRRHTIREIQAWMEKHGPGIFRVETVPETGTPAPNVGTPAAPKNSVVQDPMWHKAESLKTQKRAAIAAVEAELNAVPKGAVVPQGLGAKRIKLLNQAKALSDLQYHGKPIEDTVLKAELEKHVPSTAPESAVPSAPPVKVPEVAPGEERAAYDKAQAEFKAADAKYQAMKAAGGTDPGYGAAVKTRNRLEKVAKALRAQVPEFNLGGQEPKKALPAWGPAKS